MSEHSHLLLVNPSAGAGRAMKRLPAIEAAMRSHGLRYRIVMTSSIDHGCEQALKGAEAGEVVVVVSGDGLIGKVGGVLADGPEPSGSSPAGAATTSPASSASRPTPAAAVAILAAGSRRRIDVGEANGERFLCIASCGFDSDANRIANEAKAVKGTARLRLRGPQGALASGRRRASA